MCNEQATAAVIRKSDVDEKDRGPAIVAFFFFFVFGWPNYWSRLAAIHTL